MQVEIFTCGEAYCGQIAGLRDPLDNGQPRLDEKNPDKALRDRPVMGLQIISDLSYEGKHKWWGGTMYAPQRGKHVNVIFTLLDLQTLEASVSKFIFHKTITWTRVHEEPGKNYESDRN